jgi:hypothetical protein
VKSIREKGYVFMQKDKFDLSSDLYLALVIFNEKSEPSLYLIPSEDWREPNDLLVNRDYIGKKSKPEWGLKLSMKNQGMLEKYSLSKMASKLKHNKA